MQALSGVSNLSNMLLNYMKKVLDNRLREPLGIDKMQYGFMS